MHKNKKTDLSGKKIGDLKIINEFRAPYIGKDTHRKSILKLTCECACGKIFYPYKANVTQGKTTKCVNCANCKIKFDTKYGSLTAKKRVGSTTNGVVFLCQCECGEEENISVHILLHGKDKRCTKCRYFKKYSNKPKITKKESLAIINYKKHISHKEKIIGKKFGRLKIISFSHWQEGIKRRRSWYNAKCKCGNFIKVRTSSDVLSCGCLQKESIPKWENNALAKLTKSQADAIRELKKSEIGYTGRQIASIFGVHESVISSILLNKTYKEE